MSEVHIFASIKIKPDSIDRAKELVKDLAAQVHSKEDYTNRYLVTERIDGGGTDINVFETYKDRDSVEKHRNEPHFKAFFEAVSKEGLSAGPPYIATTKTFGGFDVDRKLL